MFFSVSESSEALTNGNCEIECSILKTPTTPVNSTASKTLRSEDDESTNDDDEDPVKDPSNLVTPIQTSRNNRKRKSKLKQITEANTAINRGLKTGRHRVGCDSYRGHSFMQISIEKPHLSQKQIDWVEPIYVPPPEVDDSEDFIVDGPTPKKRKKFKDPFVVDKILGMMVDQAGDDLYFIRWYGYDDRTWEPFQNLDNCPEKIKEFRKDMKVMPKYEDMRRRFYIDMEKFRDKINVLWPNNDSGIEVVNDIDFTAPMRTFNYIRSLQYPPDRERLPVGCECEDGICDKKCECATREGFKFAYNEDGTVNRPQNYPIFECSDSCSCNPETCPFRVVQRGRKVRLQIFKTDNGRGWGVKALENIKKNQFVVEYIGEVVSYEEADARGKQYDARGRTYLFDMDLFEDESVTYAEKFTIDAKPYGNEARFINHACKPNLFSRAVLWESVDPAIHHLALFAKRDIRIGEELSFSYNNSSLTKDNKYQANKNEGQVQCRCRKNCPNKLFK